MPMPMYSYPVSDKVSHDCATPRLCGVVWCISAQCLAAHSAQGQLFHFHTKLFENEIHILQPN